jgi:hypothetical protein
LLNPVVEKLEPAAKVEVVYTPELVNNINEPVNQFVAFAFSRNFNFENIEIACCNKPLVPEIVVP